jgi:hypothetical protein
MTNSGVGEEAADGAPSAGEDVGVDGHQGRLWRRDRRTAEDGAEQGEEAVCLRLRTRRL